MGFSDVDLDTYIDQHRLAPPAAEYLRGARAGLSRDMGDGRYASVICEFQSTKMGCSVNLESHTGELAYAIQCEYSNDVIAYFEQPPALDCLRPLKNGLTRKFLYRPDLLVLSRSGPFVAEIKSESKLRTHVATRTDWVKEDSRYRDLSAEAALEPLKLPHLVISTAQLSQVAVSNSSLLLQAVERAEVDEALLRRARKVLTTSRVISLSGLAACCDITDRTALLRLIAAGDLHTDLVRYSLVQGERCLIAANSALLADAIHDAWADGLREIEHTTGTLVTSDTLPLARYLEVALARLSALEDGKKTRNARRWRAQVNDGVAKGLSPLAALAPKYYLRGKSAKRRVVVLAFAEHIIRTRSGPPENPSFAALFRTYKTRTRDWHPAERPVSRPTFAVLFRELHKTLAGNRGGHRASNAAAMPSDVEERALRAQRPFELASCDHYLADYYCVVMEANGLRYVARPWITVLRDCHTKRILAFWLCLADPSKKSCCLVIRECLRIHGRLPETIIIDRGSDFRSVYFSELMSYCRVNLKFRPSGHPRFGSEAERLFGQYRQLWLNARPGHLLQVREVRAISGDHHPQNLACLSLREAWEDLRVFSNWLDNYATSSDVATPIALERSGLELYGCSGKQRPFDDRFIVASAIDDGRYKIDPARGIHVEPFFYWHPALATAGCEYVSTRKDPENPFRIFALVKERWYACLNGKATQFSLLPGVEQRVMAAIHFAPPQLRAAIKDDSDHLLVKAIDSRTEVRRDPVSGARLQNFKPDPKDEFFANVKSGSLPEMQGRTWN